MPTATNTIEALATQEYKYGFVTEVETESIPKGLNEDIIRLISAKKNEPDWMLDWRLKSYRLWTTMKEPRWQNVKYGPIGYQDIIYYSAPKKRPVLNSLDEVDPEIRATFEKLGIPLEEQKLFAGVAVDAVFDSVSVGTTFREKLAELGILFCSFSEAVQEYPELVRKYLGSVVPYSDNFFATLNSAVFSDGSFASLEVPGLHPAGRQFDWRVLFSRDDQQLAASGHRHQDDPPREEHEEHHRLEGDFGWARTEHRPRHGEDREERAERAQLLAVRLAVDR